MKIRKAIIPAAGLGTRFLPATKAQPKEMLPIVDKPAIQYIVEEAIASGIEDVIIVTGRNKRAIEDHFDKSMELERVLESKKSHELLQVVQDVSNMVDVYYVRQKEPLGLGHAVYTARKFIGNEPFALLLGDDIIQSDPPCLKRMIDIYEKEETSVIAVQEVPWNDVNKYGIVSLGEDGRIDDLVEKPEVGSAPSNLAVIGRYVIEPQIFDILENQEPGRGGEIQLTDALRVLNRQHRMTTYKQEGRRFDVGDKLGYIEATIEMALARPDLGPEVREYIRKIAANL
ncbi:UTP--glucose-1-phosphate uridylyltransferase GalU [Gorillibacterium timonense]|uniref:UTP--glucose-1-phosphate uridylyltransferase GalU n=1 Tax=Gorillibacterium timonense TaxID=1689269 RepID=UPI00071CC9CB|nr:UTP--glucose-1-phosphate uridylyltransferase GalU [Gorillibacterium timonense]